MPLRRNHTSYSALWSASSLLGGQLGTASRRHNLQEEWEEEITDSNMCEWLRTFPEYEDDEEEDDWCDVREEIAYFEVIEELCGSDDCEGERRELTELMEDDFR